jgi:GrpB-like predicted nucleotidyltransferase (UPF0157 family)
MRLTPEEELAAVTIGPPERLDGPVTLAEPDPAWPERFEREAARIRAALGARALLVKHAGSTAVPGLVAKPVIDIVLAVADSADEPAYVPALEAVGYRLRIRSPAWEQHRMLNGPDTPVNLHVFSLGSPALDRMLRFRDRLRESPAARERYAAEKRALAARTWAYLQHYADAKGPVIEAILAHRPIVETLCDRLTGSDVTWAMTGSVALSLHGLDVTCDDVDVATTADGARAIEAAFADEVLTLVRFQTRGEMRGHLGSLRLDGVVVELLGDVQNTLPGGEWSTPPAVEREREWIALGERRCPVLGLASLQRAYELMGRVEKAQRIATVLRERARAR